MKYKRLLMFLRVIYWLSVALLITFMAIFTNHYGNVAGLGAVLAIVIATFVNELRAEIKKVKHVGNR